MIEKIIEFSIRNRFVVIVLACAVIAWGVYSVINTPVDAIPDLSENQVIVFTDWMGRSPREIEDQITYPLSVNLQGPGGREVGPLVQRVQLLDDQHHLRGQRRLLLRPAAGAGAAHAGQHVSAARGGPLPGARRHGAGADLLVHRRRRRLRPGPAPGRPRLVRPLPDQFRAGRGPGGLRGRLPDRVSDRRRSAKAPRLRHHPGRVVLRRGPLQLRGGRAGHPQGKRRVSDPQRRLDPIRPRHRKHRRQDEHREGHARAASPTWPRWAWARSSAAACWRRTATRWSARW